ncbi:hypothetical protein [Winogradskyella sp. MIT101101]|uniref:hypothetical protein n=1 Tax=Winogradskyella sp. MIT101101 TaxID=3098297 RepID=UPI00399AB723
MKHIFRISLFIILISCKSKSANSDGISANKAIPIDFCNLKNHANKLITTDLIYSGVDEYWSASGYGTCGDGFNEVYLNFDNYYRQKGNKSIIRKLNKVHSKYYMYKAKMTVTGIFQVSPIQEDIITNKDTIISTLNGFGHLNSYNSRIKIISVRDIEILEK